MSRCEVQGFRVAGSRFIADPPSPRPIQGPAASSKELNPNEHYSPCISTRPHTRRKKVHLGLKMTASSQNVAATYMALFSGTCLTHDALQNVFQLLRFISLCDQTLLSLQQKQGILIITHDALQKRHCFASVCVRVPSSDTKVN